MTISPRTATGGRGFVADRAGCEAGTRPGQAITIGSSDESIEKILDAERVLGGLDRFYGQVDWGGLPRPLVEASIARLATEIAPAVRSALAP